MTEKTKSKAKFKSQAVSKEKKPRHDSLVKKAMESPVAAMELLEEYLPQDMQDFLNLSTLKIEKESYVDESLKKKFSDVVYSVKTRNHEQALVYTLIEHQATSDYWLAFRIFQYTLLLLERHKKKKDKLPIVIPLVIYNGKKKYDAPLNIWQLFTHPEIAKKALSSDYKLIDLQAMSDDDINYEKHLSFLLYTMKHIHDRDTLKMLEEAMQRCYKAILIDKGKDYVHTKLILWYTDSKVAEEKKQQLEQLVVDNLPHEDTEEVMRTIAQAYIEEGVEKGIHLGEARGKAEGKAEIAKNLLLQNISLDTISTATGLSHSDIQKLKDTTC